MLQALKEVPIYAKIVSDLCIKNLGWKPKDPTTIHVMGKLSKLMSSHCLLTKYHYPRNPRVTVYINDHPIGNGLIDVGAAINVMTKDLFIALDLLGLRHTPTMFELADRSHVKLKGML